jgi:cell division protein FtsB
MDRMDCEIGIVAVFVLVAFLGIVSISKLDRIYRCVNDLEKINNELVQRNTKLAIENARLEHELLDKKALIEVLKMKK